MVVEYTTNLVDLQYLKCLMFFKEGFKKIILIKKNPACGRHWISWPMRIVSPLPWREEKTFMGGSIFFFFSLLSYFRGVHKNIGGVYFFLIFLLRSKNYFFKWIQNYTTPKKILYSCTFFFKKTKGIWMPFGI